MFVRVERVRIWDCRGCLVRPWRNVRLGRRILGERVTEKIVR
jgi:hypothetical protein